MRRALALVALVLVACSASAPEVDASKGQIRVDLKDYTVTLTSTEMRAGTITLLGFNSGGTGHEVVVLKTDLAADKLPIDPQTQKAKEDGKQGAVSEIAPGKTGNLRLDLPAGRYVVICNVPTHYQLGMHAELKVS